MKKKKVIAITAVCLIAAILTAAGISSIVLYRNGNLGFAHPLVKARDGQIKVACVGDSITYGAGISGWPDKSYPYALRGLLGEGCAVNNYGYSARTAMYDGDYPYVSDKLYKKSLAFRPDIVVIMLGTNDSKPYNWKGKEAFISDYTRLIKSYAALDSAPEIYVAAPPPVFPVDGEVKYDIDGVLIDGDIYAAAQEIAAAGGLHFIDMNAVFRSRADLFPDGIHPNAEGAGILAQAVYEAIAADL